MADWDCELDLGRGLTPAEAQQELGIPAATVRTWHHRRERTGLYPIARVTGKNLPVFWEADLLALRHGLRLRDDEGRRVIESIDDVR